jgi:hypothetical protein
MEHFGVKSNLCAVLFLGTDIGLTWAITAHQHRHQLGWTLSFGNELTYFLSYFVPDRARQGFSVE